MINNHFLFILGLIWAAGRGFPEVVKVLLDAGAKVDVGDKVRNFCFMNRISCLRIIEDFAQKYDN